MCKCSSNNTLAAAAAASAATAAKLQRSSAASIFQQFICSHQQPHVHHPRIKLINQLK
jgi:hypothetical protein